MPKFGSKSKKRLESCHPYIQLIMNEIIKDIDITILEGHRGKDKQNNYYEAGKSKLRFPDSRHNKNPSLAVDIAIWHKDDPNIDWKNKKEWFYLGGYVKGIAKKLGIKIRWGRDWDGDHDLDDQDFNDCPHFELDNI